MAVIKGGIVEPGTYREDLDMLLNFQYEFAGLGGAQGAITLTDEKGKAQVLPAGYVVTDAWLEAITNLTSGGAATVALGVTGAATAIKTATAYNDATLTVTSATSQSLPAQSASDRNVLATIATADLTAGKFNVYLRCIKGEVAV